MPVYPDTTSFREPTYRPVSGRSWLRDGSRFSDHQRAAKVLHDSFEKVDGSGHRRSNGQCGSRDQWSSLLCSNKQHSMASAVAKEHHGWRMVLLHGASRACYWGKPWNDRQQTLGPAWCRHSLWVPRMTLKYWSVPFRLQNVVAGRPGSILLRSGVFHRNACRSLKKC